MVKKKTKETKEPDEVIILECTFCLRNYNWNRTEHPEGYGYCFCRKARFLESIGKDQQFRVRKDRRAPGHVIVMTYKGWQELSGPGYQEKQDRWKPYPVELPKKT